LGLSLVAQIVTGILLAMHYQGSALDAFQSVEHKFKALTLLLMIYFFILKTEILNSEKNIFLTVNKSNKSLELKKESFFNKIIEDKDFLE